jgi:hypothetical protein
VFVKQPQVLRTLRTLVMCTSFQKALYGLKQAPRAWNARFKSFLLEHGYVMGSVDKTLFTLKHGNDFYLFRYTWKISFSVALLTLLCQVFRQ